MVRVRKGSRHDTFNVLDPMTTGSVPSCQLPQGVHPNCVVAGGGGRYRARTGTGVPAFD